MLMSDIMRRLSEATGPDQELDALILCAMLAPAGSKVEQSRFNGAWCVYEPAAQYSKAPFKAWERPRAFRDDGPTASAGAAFALIANGMPESIWYGVEYGAVDVPSFHGWVRRSIGALQIFEFYAPTSALALTGAVWRAFEAGRTT